ncbi:hypothetical protein RV07_GL002278 [Enterococcus malodoratus]|nr:hypothetical protein RV07_GL002278 [Enterococcus malodoratus]
MQEKVGFENKPHKKDQTPVKMIDHKSFISVKFCFGLVV